MIKSAFSKKGFFMVQKKLVDVLQLNNIKENQNKKDIENIKRYSKEENNLSLLSFFSLYIFSGLVYFPFIHFGTDIGLFSGIGKGGTFESNISLLVLFFALTPNIFFFYKNNCFIDNYREAMDGHEKILIFLCSILLFLILFLISIFFVISHFVYFFVLSLCLLYIVFKLRTIYSYLKNKKNHNNDISKLLKENNQIKIKKEELFSQIIKDKNLISLIQKDNKYKKEKEYICNKLINNLTNDELLDLIKEDNVKNELSTY